MVKLVAYTLLILSSCLGLALSLDDEVCYEDICCFENGAPFFDPLNRPISWMPECREAIGTVFKLNTRGTPDTQAYHELSTYEPESTFGTSDFQAYRETKIITHGFTQSSSVEWMETMVDEFLIHGDYNIIRVDWRRGAIDLYGIAASNTRVVGAEISLLIDLLKNYYGVSASSFHIIGHSLGAHVAGYAGERQRSPMVSRITGLDPAGPYFEDMDPIVRLDPTDAEFVDVIHSDTDPIYTLGYGMYAPCGHMDFFPNGGRAQPGCDQGFFEFIGSEGGLWDGTTQFVACNHLRSIEYFTESINSDGCNFLAFRCTRDYDDYDFGSCFNDELSAKMGWESPDYYPGGTGVIYQINTRYESPFCGHQYLFTIKMDEHRKAKDAKGRLYITLIGYDGQSEKFPLTQETEEYDKGLMYVHMGISDAGPYDLGDLSGLFFEWEYDADWYKWWDWEAIERPELFIHQIIVTDTEGNEMTMCGDYDGIEPGYTKGFGRSSTVCPPE